MFKEEKTVITREQILKEFQMASKLSIAPRLVLLFVGSFLTWVVFSAFLNTVTVFNAEGALDIGLHEIFPILLLLVTILLETFFVWLFVANLIDVVRYKHRDFCVVEDTLSRIEEEYVRYGKGRRLEQALYFRRYGRYTVSQKDGSVYEYSSPEDKFFLVLAGKGAIRRVYNQKVYEYKER